MRMRNKVAVVTGGGRDIGRACALRLAADGAAVAINYHSSADGAESAVAEIEAEDGRAFALQGDMTKPEDVAALVAEAVKRWGRVDALVHVTGGLVARKKLSEMSVDHWRHVMDLNLTSFVHLVQAGLPHLGAGGSIVSIASQAARDGGGPGAVAYASSKGAIVTMTRGLAKELGPDIRVNSVCPGMISTGFHDTFSTPEGRANVAKATPLKREGSSEEVANLVAFLASDEAAFVTGANVDINGGLAFS